MPAGPSSKSRPTLPEQLIQAFLRQAVAPNRSDARLARPETVIDLRAALEARRELGQDYEELVVERFLQEVERAIDARVEQRLAEYERRRRRTAWITTPRLILLLAFAIPLTAIGGSTAGLPGILAAWAGVLALHFLSWRR
uniref:Uncharacterized protein n=1 Tax=Thermorudis peleae TaxID=1382356 RepID=A0A831TF43_9BACT